MWLSLRGAVVSGVALPPEAEPNLFSSAQLAKDIDSTFVDVRQPNDVATIVNRIEPEIIFHLAAQPLVRRSYQEPAYTFEVNVMGTVHVLEAARAVPSVRVIIVVTSDKCYENRNWHWPYREYEPMGGHDPYSSSKGCAELVTAAWRNSFFDSGSSGNRRVALASVRAGNVIGGGDWAEDRLIPDCVRAFEFGRPVVIRYPDAVRPWQHVLDPLHGYMLLAQKMWEQGHAFAEPWNLGPTDDDARPVSWIVDRMVNLWGENACWQFVKGEQPHEAVYLRIDSSKARARLGWRPLLTIENALAWTVEWHSRLPRDGARNLTIEQICRYDTLIAAALPELGVNEPRA